MKRYTQSSNAYHENQNGIVLGAEKTKENGNSYLAVLPDFPSFSPSLKLATATYHVYIKAAGDDVFLLREVVEKTFKGEAFLHSNINSPDFGKACEQETEGALPDIELFAKVFYGDFEGVKMKDFINATLQSLLNKY